MTTQVEALAKYAARASFADLSAESRRQLPIHVLDCLGCCIAALGAGPVEACRQQVEEFGSPGPCVLIGGKKANPVYAAFWHTALARYVDFMDNFLAQSETCHTADNFGVALTIADYIGGTGRELMLEKLTAGRIDAALSRTVKDAVSSLESIQIRDLMAPLTRISPANPALGTASGQN